MMCAKVRKNIGMANGKGKEFFRKETEMDCFVRKNSSNLTLSAELF